MLMVEIVRLLGGSTAIESVFVDRVFPPKPVMELGVELRLRRLSLSNTDILEKFNIDRCRSTVHKWVRKSDLDPRNDRNPAKIALDEPVVRSMANSTGSWPQSSPKPTYFSTLGSILPDLRWRRSCFSRSSERNTRATMPNSSSMAHRGCRLDRSNSARTSAMKHTATATSRTCISRYKTTNRTVLQ